MLNNLVNKVQSQKDLYNKIISATPKTITAKIPQNFDYKKYLDLLPYVDANGVAHNMPKVPSTFKVGDYTFKLSLFRSPTPAPSKMYTPIESYKSPNSTEHFTPLPSSLLLFTQAGYNPPVKNQGSTSECVAYSSSLMREYQQFINTVRLFDQCFAPDFLYNFRSDPNADGMCLSNAMDILQTKGHCTQTDYYANNSCPSATTYTIPSYGCVYFQGMSSTPTQNSVVTNIKNALYNNGPCLVAFIIYQACNASQDPRADGRIWIPLPQNISSCESGGHCMTIIGWDDSNGFLIQNSWGPNWNGNGCVWLPYEDILQPYGPLEIWCASSLDSSKPYALAYKVNPPPSPEVTPIYQEPPSSTQLGLSLSSNTIYTILGVVAVGAIIYGVYTYYKKRNSASASSDDSSSPTPTA
jgi:C1A family cysteine protease